MMSKWLMMLAGAAAVLALPGCATSPKPFAMAPGVQQLSGEMPAPTALDYASPVRDFYIGPGDKLKIDVFGVPEMTREAQVDGAGQLSFPLVGTVTAAGRTPAQVSADIEQRLRANYVKNPQVTVNVEESYNQTLTVDGQVVKPGMYPLVGRLTLQRAVALAGGTAEFAKLKDVIVRREVGDQTYIGIYNLDAIRRGNYIDPEVYPSDVIVVGDSKERRLFRDVLQIVPLLTTPLILLLQNN
ncbi:polysaccharide export protein [Altererythrobacter aerius]|uniref:Polysaccharide export protein n=1 Tax=Tsuneonella aeria TaxID=1837929 RepID=A0A6I4TDW0_9SPHN|nr:polysaccharide biosynthesis/export family protein [Tsuneonella aeria]MXO75491.1 polysaccharide export protein [Tsuneonella aeria]